MRKRSFLLSSLCLLAATAAQAQTFPNGPVRLIVLNVAGSPPDLLARRLGAKLAAEWKSPVVVENRPGAGGAIAADAVAKAAPDGRTLLVGADGPITILPALGATLPYDAQRDLAPVAALGETDFVLVTHPGTGWRTLADFVRAAKARPGQLNYASGGNGSPQQLAAELLKQRAGLYVTHIPYRAAPAGLQDVLAGRIDAMFIAVGAALPQIQAGRLVPLASGGARRHPLLPNTPALAESYPDLRAGTWFGLFAPAATPPATLRLIEAASTQALADPALRAEFAAQGVDITGEPGASLRTRVHSESARFAALARATGIRPD
ncbi:MAG: tripartite tricarboxylate transporter substrate-binding protein [Bordetella sp.]|nr:tripartite tricarboxylate transporter substrate-binding protein [Pseudomonadota bacterium]